MILDFSQFRHSGQFTSAQALSDDGKMPEQRGPM